MADVETVVQKNWRQALLDEGLSEGQTEEWAGCFAPLPDTL